MILFFLRQLFSGCWTHDLVRERHGKQYVLRCTTCGYQTAILQGQKFRKRKVAKKPVRTKLKILRMAAQASRRS